MKLCRLFFLINSLAVSGICCLLLQAVWTQITDQARRNLKPDLDSNSSALMVFLKDLKKTKKNSAYEIKFWKITQHAKIETKISDRFDLVSDPIWNTVVTICYVGRPMK